MKELKLLLVDDEPNLLEGLKRQFRNKFNIETALGPEEGLRLVREKGPFALVISDMRMPKISGVEFLSQVRAISPDTVRVMLTGNADQETAIQAVNDSNIFRFLLKPCLPETVAKAIEDGLQQYRLIRAERDLLENTVTGCVKLLSELMNQHDSELAAENTLHRETVGFFTRKLSLHSFWEIEVAASLVDIGCMTLPADVVRRVRAGKPRDGNEMMISDSLPKFSSELLRIVPRFSGIADIVFYSKKNFDGSGFPENHPGGSEIPIESRILRIAVDFARLLLSCNNALSAVTSLQSFTGRYDPQLLSLLAAEHSQVNDALEQEGVEIDIKGLTVGHNLKADICALNGRLLLAKGNTVTDFQLSRIHNHHRLSGVKLPFLVDVRIPVVGKI